MSPLWSWTSTDWEPQMITEIALACLLAGVLVGMSLCGAMWAAGERAARRERIERARGRDHRAVPSIRASLESAQ